MKKLVQSLITAVGLLSVSLSSCYKDKSTLPSNPIPDVVIDTVGIAKEQFVDFQTHLIISPKPDPKFEDADVSYKWQITATTDQRSTDLETIGTDLRLDYIATKPISSKPYYLFLTITDNKHGGIEYIYSWPLTIRGSYISGLVVADTKDGGAHTDLTYIKDQSVSIKYKGDQAWFRDILGSTPEGAIPGRANKITYAYWGYATYFGRDSYLWVSTDDGKLYKYNTKDFSLAGNLSDDRIAIYKSGDIRVKNHFSAGEYYFLDTTDGIYKISHRSRNAETVFSVPESVLAGTKISNNIVGVSGNRQNNDGFAIYYDEGKEAILGFAKYQSYSFNKETFAANEQFDPGKLPNRTAIAADISDDGKFGRILLKNNSTDNYELYIVKMHEKERKDNAGKVIQHEEMACAQSKYSISPDGKSILDEAKSVFFSKKYNLLYAVTKDKIYAFTFIGTSQEIKPSGVLYEVNAGEVISNAKLFIQGEYNFEPTLVGGSLLPELKYNCMALILSIQKGEDGLVRILPIDPNFATSGILLRDKANDYTGFGTILDVTPIGE